MSVDGGLYLDTALLAAYYAPEPASEEAESIVRASAQPAISDLTELELVAALSRKARHLELSLDDARRLRGAFFAHLDDALYTRLPLGREHYRLARDWLGRPEVHLAPRQALHLTAATLAGRTFATLDRELASAAAELGVVTLPLGDEADGSQEVHEPPAEGYGTQAGDRDRDRDRD